MITEQSRMFAEKITRMPFGYMVGLIAFGQESLYSTRTTSMYVQLLKQRPGVGRKDLETLCDRRIEALSQHRDGGRRLLSLSLGINWGSEVHRAFLSGLARRPEVFGDLLNRALDGSISLAEADKLARNLHKVLATEKPTGETGMRYQRVRIYAHQWDERTRSASDKIKQASSERYTKFLKEKAEERARLQAEEESYQRLTQVCARHSEYFRELWGGWVELPKVIWYYGLEGNFDLLGLPGLIEEKYATESRSVDLVRTLTDSFEKSVKRKEKTHFSESLKVQLRIENIVEDILWLRCGIEMSNSDLVSFIRIIFNENSRLSRKVEKAASQAQWISAWKLLNKGISNLPKTVGSVNLSLPADGGGDGHKSRHKNNL